MNTIEQMQTWPFLIAALAFIFAVAWISWQKGKIWTLKEDLALAREQRDLSDREIERLKIIIEKQKEELEEIARRRDRAWQAGKEASDNLITVMCRLQKLEFLLKHGFPQLYDEKRLDLWIQRTREKKEGRNGRPIPSSITREVKAAAGTAREIKNGAPRKATSREAEGMIREVKKKMS